SGPGPNLISFDISGSGIQEISPTSPLPTVTTPVVIDATTQPGYSGAPLIQLDGASAGNATALTITAGSSTVEGLEITHWSGTGIALKTNGSNTIAADYLGTDGSSA